MKLFSWVHKTFHPQYVHKEGFVQNVKKSTETPMREIDRHALLKQLDLEDGLLGWKDGILTIGTFGFEALKPSNQKEYLVLENNGLEQDEEDDIDEEEAEDEMFGNSEHDHREDNVYDNNYYVEDDEEEQEMELNPLMFTTFGKVFGDDHVHDNGEKLDDRVIAEIIEEERREKGKRITLADLFLAEADVMKMRHENDQPGRIKVLTKDSSKKQDDHGRTKKKISFAKKLISRAKTDKHPIKNFHRLMKRMLKRKIHPEMNDKVVQKPEFELATDIANAEYGTFESVSLLPAQDVTNI